MVQRVLESSSLTVALRSRKLSIPLPLPAGALREKAISEWRASLDWLLLCWSVFWHDVCVSACGTCCEAVAVCVCAEVGRCARRSHSASPNPGKQGSGHPSVQSSAGSGVQSPPLTLSNWTQRAEKARSRQKPSLVSERGIVRAKARYCLWILPRKSADSDRIYQNKITKS